jgi:phospholipase/lecithinase/hemolysin
VRYLEDWNDELHPTRAGFELVADKIAGAIE